MFLDFVKEKRVQQIIFAINGLTQCCEVKDAILKEFQLKAQHHLDLTDCYKKNYENYVERERYEKILTNYLINLKISNLLEKIGLESNEKNVKYTQFKQNQMNELTGIKSIAELLLDEQELLIRHPNSIKEIQKVYAYYLKDTIEILHVQRVQEMTKGLVFKRKVNK